MPNINYTAVIISTVVFMGLGFFWYGFLFSKPWTKLMGWDLSDKKKMKEMQQSAGPAYMVSFFGCLFEALLLAYLFNKLHTTAYVNNIWIAIILWLGVQVPATLTTAMFNKKPLGLWAIDTSYQLAGLIISAAIITSMLA